MTEDSLAVVYNPGVCNSVMFGGLSLVFSMWGGEGEKCRCKLSFSYCPLAHVGICCPLSCVFKFQSKFSFSACFSNKLIVLV